MNHGHENFTRKEDLTVMGLEERRKREKEQRRGAILNAARKLFFKMASPQPSSFLNLPVFISIFF
jgi:hypothetical protein